MVIFRFFYGLRNPTPWVLGSSRTVSFKKFLLLNGIGALIWAIGVAWGGYAFGMLIDHFLGQVKNIMLLILALLAILVPLSIWLWRWRRRKALSQAERLESMATTDEEAKMPAQANPSLSEAEERTGANTAS
jgi:membrane protein DedA with SNARE-associated domain